MNISFDPSFTGNPYTSNLANSKDPDEMQHYRLKQPSGTEIHQLV